MLNFVHQPFEQCHIQMGINKTKMVVGVGVMFLEGKRGGCPH